MSFLEKHLYTKDSIQINKTSFEIKTALIANKANDFHCKFEENQYCITANFSLGTMQINSFGGNSISTNLQFIENSNFTEVKMKSGFRYEYLIIILSFLFISTVLIIKNFELKLLFLPVLFIITILWFRMIYQNQEKELHSKIKKYLLSI